MPNHWHLLVWPERDDQLSRYMRWITGVHGQRWRQARGQSGKGAVYQGHIDGSEFRGRTLRPRDNTFGRILFGRAWSDHPDAWPWSSANCAPVEGRPLLAQCPRSLDAADRGRDPADDGPLDVTTVDRMHAVSGPGMRLVMRNGATR